MGLSAVDCGCWGRQPGSRRLAGVEMAEGQKAVDLIGGGSRSDRVPNPFVGLGPFERMVVERQAKEGGYGDAGSSQERGMRHGYCRAFPEILEC